MTVTVLPAPHAGLNEGLFLFGELANSNAVAKLRKFDAGYSMHANIRICKKKQKCLKRNIDASGLRGMLRYG